MLEFNVVGIARRYSAVSVRSIQSAAVRVSELVGQSMILPVRHLKLQRMISGTQRTVILIHRRELRVEDQEILWEAILRVQPSAANAGHICGFEEIRQLSDVAVSEH